MLTLWQVLALQNTSSSCSGGSAVDPATLRTISSAGCGKCCAALTGDGVDACGIWGGLCERRAKAVPKEGLPPRAGCNHGKVPHTVQQSARSSAKTFMFTLRQVWSLQTTNPCRSVRNTAPHVRRREGDLSRERDLSQRASARTMACSAALLEPRALPAPGCVSSKLVCPGFLSN